MIKKKWVPWYARILAKIILTRLPLGYRFWTKVGVFKHGAMESPIYAWDVVEKHAQEISGRKSWRGLELGPGDTMTSAIVAPAFGADGITLVDAGAFAIDAPNHYFNQVKELRQKYPEAKLPDLNSCSTLADILDKVGGSYHTNGLASLKSLEGNSFGLIFSQAVLEHVRKSEIADLVKEFRRVIAPNGKMSHVVDFKDHLGGKWNNLRLPSSLWEKDWFAQKSSFYTNRIQLSEMIEIFVEAGFTVEIRTVTLRATAPDAPHKFAKEFQDLSSEDLMVDSAHLVMTPA